MTLRKRTLLALAALALAVLGMFLATWIVAAEQASDSLVVNLAGRQRMLTQKMSKEVLESVRLAGSGEAEAASRKVKLTASLFDATQRALEDGGEAPSGLDPAGPRVTLPKPSPEVREHLAKVQKLWASFKEDLPAGSTGDAPALQRVLAGNLPLLAALNESVSAMQREAESRVSGLLATQFACILVILAILGLVSRILYRDIISPLESLRSYTREVAAGNLQARVAGRFIHELASLMRDVTGMVGTLDKALAEVREKDQTERFAAEARQALEQARNQESKVQGLLTALSTAASRAEDVSRKTQTAVAELIAQVDSVSNGVAVQRNRMEEVSTAMEEMNSTVLEVARNASLAAQSAALSKDNAAAGAIEVRRTVDDIRASEQSILDLKASMSRLGSEADNIGRINVVISDIADQTNLLALNAAIEAARAGDAGRGFAVVADEVRKLAEKTMGATKEVSEAIHNIQTHARQNVAAVDTAAQIMAKSTGSAGESGRFMEQIVDIVESTAVQVQSIATASEEQSEAAQEINQAMADVNQVAADTAKWMEASAQALQEMSTLMEELDAVIRGMLHADAEASPESGGTGELFPWTAALATGIRTIDEQHKVLVGLINELHAAMRDRKGSRIMSSVMDQLRDYTEKHFSFEQTQYARHGYPETAAHKEIHREFVAKIRQVADDLRNEKATASQDIMLFLKKWLIEHIQGTDKQYVPFLKAHGGS